jgi:hypothetical protein
MLNNYDNIKVQEYIVSISLPNAVRKHQITKTYRGREDKTLSRSQHNRRDEVKLQAPVSLPPTK